MSALVSLVLAATSSIAFYKTLWEGKAGPFDGRTVLWGVSELTLPKLRSFYQQMSRELKSARAWTVYVFVDQTDAAHEVSGKMVTDKGYDWWLDLYNEFGRKPLPMAEISNYGDNAVLRLRDARGICSETVLSGDNFLRISLNDTKFEILKTYYRPLPPHTDSTPGDEAMITVYVRSSSFPSVEEARAFSRVMQGRFREKRVMIIFRTDAFFIAELDFPVMYRFDSGTTPPSKEQYEHSKTMYCFCDQPGIACRVRGK